MTTFDVRGLVGKAKDITLYDRLEGLIRGGVAHLTHG